MPPSAPHHCRALLPRASPPLRPCSAITKRLRLPLPLPLTPSGSPSPLLLQPRACQRAAAMAVVDELHCRRCSFSCCSPAPPPSTPTAPRPTPQLRNPSPPPFAAGSSLLPARPPLGRPRTGPGGHGPSPATVRSSTGAPYHRASTAPLPCRRRPPPPSARAGARRALLPS